jgi:hypothetical protein
MGEGKLLLSVIKNLLLISIVMGSQRKRRSIKGRVWLLWRDIKIGIS